MIIAFFSHLFDWIVRFYNDIETVITLVGDWINSHPILIVVIVLCFLILSGFFTGVGDLLFLSLIAFVLLGYFFHPAFYKVTLIALVSVPLVLFLCLFLEKALFLYLKASYKEDRR